MTGRVFLGKVLKIVVKGGMGHEQAFLIPTASRGKVLRVSGSATHPPAHAIPALAASGISTGEFVCA